MVQWQVVCILNFYILEKPKKHCKQIDECKTRNFSRGRNIFVSLATELQTPFLKLNLKASLEDVASKTELEEEARLIDGYTPQSLSLWIGVNVDKRGDKCKIKVNGQGLVTITQTKCQSN